MSRGPLLLIPLAVVVAGCGGSQKQASSSRTTAGVTHGASSSATSTNASTSQHKRRRRKRSGSLVTKASGVRLPATYAIGPGGALTPRLVSAPASVAIAFTAVSSDGQAHRVRLRAPNGPSLTVPAGGRASAIVSALNAGSYPVYVDGIRRGVLVIGVAPGP